MNIHSDCVDCSDHSAQIVLHVSELLQSGLWGLRQLKHTQAEGAQRKWMQLPHLPMKLRKQHHFHHSLRLVDENSAIFDVVWRRRRRQYDE